MDSKNVKLKQAILKLDRMDVVNYMKKKNLNYDLEIQRCMACVEDFKSRHSELVSQSGNKRMGRKSLRRSSRNKEAESVRETRSTSRSKTTNAAYVHLSRNDLEAVLGCNALEYTLMRRAVEESPHQYSLRRSQLPVDKIQFKFDLYKCARETNLMEVYEDWEDKKERKERMEREERLRKRQEKQQEILRKRQEKEASKNEFKDMVEKINESLVTELPNKIPDDSVIYYNIIVEINNDIMTVKHCKTYENDLVLMNIVEYDMKNYGKEVKTNKKKKVKAEDSTKKPKKAEDDTKKPEKVKDSTKKPKKAEDDPKKPEKVKDNTKKPNKAKDDTKKPEKAKNDTKKSKEAVTQEEKTYYFNYKVEIVNNKSVGRLKFYKTKPKPSKAEVQPIVEEAVRNCDLSLPVIDDDFLSLYNYLVGKGETDLGLEDFPLSSEPVVPSNDFFIEPVGLNDTSNGIINNNDSFKNLMLLE